MLINVRRHRDEKTRRKGDRETGRQGDWVMRRLSKEF